MCRIDALQLGVLIQQRDAFGRCKVYLLDLVVAKCTSMCCTTQHVSLFLPQRFSLSSACPLDSSFATPGAYSALSKCPENNHIAIKGQKGLREGSNSIVAKCG